MTTALLECAACKGHGVRICEGDCQAGTRWHSHMCDDCGGQGRRKATVLGESPSRRPRWAAWKAVYFDQ